MLHMAEPVESGTNSTVWMREEMQITFLRAFFVCSMSRKGMDEREIPELSSGIFYRRISLSISLR